MTKHAKLSPEDIHSLLRIDVEVSEREVSTIRENRKNMNLWLVFSIIIYSTILAFGSILTVMYVQNFGLFHPGL